MKTASKVFIILSMIVQCILIYPIVLGAMALKRLNTARTAEELKGWAIVTLIFVNTIAGILMLCMKDADLQKDSKKNSMEDGDEIAKSYE